MKFKMKAFSELICSSMNVTILKIDECTQQNFRKVKQIKQLKNTKKWKYTLWNSKNELECLSM